MAGQHTHYDDTDRDDTGSTIPIGQQRMTGVGALVTAYRRMKSPVLISERVWIERKGDGLAVHMGRPAAEEITDRPA